MSTDVAAQIQVLVAGRALYPLVATVLALLIQAIRKSPRTATWWQRVPTGWRWLVPVGMGALVGFVRGYQAELPLSGALISGAGEALAGVFGVSLTSMGLAAALRESPLPWDGGAGGQTPPKS